MAIDFDGTNDSLDFGNLAYINGAAALTFGGWINEDTTVGRQGLWCKYDGTTVTIIPDLNQVTAATLKILFDFGNTIYATLANAVVVGTWTHLMIVYDGSGATNADRLKAYKDGVLQTLTFTGTIPATLSTSTLGWKVGELGNVAYFFNGKQAHYKLWTAVLSADEIAQEFQSARPVRHLNLRHYVPMFDTTAKNYKHGEADPTVNGAPVLATVEPPVCYGGRG